MFLIEHEVEGDELPGILEEFFNVRTHGNGHLRSAWDEVLLKRDLDRALAAGLIRELPCPPPTGRSFAMCDPRRFFLDCATNDIYEYVGPGEKRGSQFRKAKLEDIWPAVKTYPV